MVAAHRQAGVEQIGRDVVPDGIVGGLVPAIATTGGAGSGAGAARLAVESFRAGLARAVAVQRRDVGLSGAQAGRKGVGHADAGAGVGAPLCEELSCHRPRTEAALVAAEAAETGGGGAGEGLAGRGIGTGVGRGLDGAVGVSVGVAGRAEEGGEQEQEEVSHGQS